MAVLRGSCSSKGAAAVPRPPGPTFQLPPQQQGGLVSHGAKNSRGRKEESPAECRKSEQEREESVGGLVRAGIEPVGPQVQGLVHSRAVWTRKQPNFGMGCHSQSRWYFQSVGTH